MHAAVGFQILFSEPAQQSVNNFSYGHGIAAEIFVLKAPDITSRRVAITNMQRAGRDAAGLGHTMTA